MSSSVFIDDQKNIIIKGAKRVVSSTNTQAVVEILNSCICITGSEIEVKKLDLNNGEVSFNGVVSNIKFSDKPEKISLFKRIFK
ncbi:MAG: hypothetical protein IJ008_00015 [Clostridia bacterium]|nr:hypothetical protein [Clostridia bacterium]